MILEIRREEPASNSTNSRQDSADAPHRKGTMPPGKTKPRTGRGAHMVPQTDLEWVVKGHGERLRHQEQVNTLQVSSKKRSEKGVGLVPKQCKYNTS